MVYVVHDRIRRDDPWPHPIDDQEFRMIESRTHYILKKHFDRSNLPRR